MKIIKSLFLIGIFVFIGCKYENKSFDKFYETEKKNLVAATKEVIVQLGLENFEILIYPHKNITNGLISRNASDTSWSGTSFTPEGPPNSGETNNPAFRDLSDSIGQMRQKTVSVSYKPNSKKEITFNQFSMLILFDDIHEKQKDQLLEILNSYLTNIERGDTITIISKNEFTKLSP